MVGPAGQLCTGYSPSGCVCLCPRLEWRGHTVQPRPKTLLAWITGKDSAWSLHVLTERKEVDVVGLLTTVNSRYHRVSLHGVRAELLRVQAAAVGLPLVEVALPDPCCNAEYEAAMSAALGRAKAEGVTAIAFGDLLLEDVRRYREERLAPAGITPLFPLWGQRELAADMLAGGLRARLTSVDLKKLGRAFCGREYDRGLLEELPPSIDPSGENGEFHTFVYAGPMFRQALRVSVRDVVERDGFAFADVVPGG